MPIDSTIETAFTKQYGPSLYILTQQRFSKFAPKVRRETVSGATVAFYDRLGEADGEEITTRYPKTPVNEIPNTRRRVGLTGVHTNQPLDSLDKLQIMIEPQSSYQQAQAMYLARVQDDRIVAAMIGTANAGVDGDTSVTFAQDSISINGDGTITSLGTGATPQTEVDITLAKILSMLQIFNDLDVDEDIVKYWAVRPKSISDMLDITEIGSADYNTVKAIQAGKMNPYCGFNWFWSNRITLNTSDETCYRSLAWAADGVIFATWADVMSRVSERSDLSYTLQVYSKMVNGAVRMDGAKVHECLNKVAV